MVSAHAHRARSWNSPTRSAGNTGFYLPWSVAAKQSGPKPGWLSNWGLIQELVYSKICVQDTCATPATWSSASLTQWASIYHKTLSRKLLLQMSWIRVLPSHSCGGTLQKSRFKLLHSSMQTSADHRSRQCHVSRMTDEKRWDLVSLRNVKSEEQARVYSGRLFHARAAATGKARSPRVARRVVDGTCSVVVSACRAETSI